MKTTETMEAAHQRRLTTEESDLSDRDLALLGLIFKAQDLEKEASVLRLLAEKMPEDMPSLFYQLIPKIYKS